MSKDAQESAAAPGHSVAGGSIVHAIFGTSVSSIAVVGFTFVTGVLVARVLGPASRADYGIIILVAQMAATLGCLSFFDGAMVQMRRQASDPLSLLPTLLLVAMAISTLATIGAGLSLPYVGLANSDVSGRFIVVFCALIILSYLFIQCFSAVDRARLKFTMINVERAVAPGFFVLFLLAIYAFYGSLPSLTLVLATFVVSKIPVIVIWSCANRRQVVGRVDWRFARESARTGARLHVAVALAALAAQLDRIFAIGTWPKELLGQYFVAFSAVGAGYSVIAAAMNTLLLPYLAGTSTEMRAERIGQLVRVTILITVLTVVAGAVILPIAVPVLYGPAFQGAATLALGLLLAMAVLPLRTIVLEAGRSLGKGRPSVEMAVVSIATMCGGFFLTEFKQPWHLILTLAASNVLSTIAGARHMVVDGDIRLDSSLLPALADLRFVKLLFIRTKRKPAQ